MSIDVAWNAVFGAFIVGVNWEQFGLGRFSSFIHYLTEMQVVTFAVVKRTARAILAKTAA